MNNGSYTFPDKTIVSFDGLVAVSPVMLDYALFDRGRAYFELSYDGGCKVRVPSDTYLLNPALDNEQVTEARDTFVRYLMARVSL